MMRTTVRNTEFGVPSLLFWVVLLAGCVTQQQVQQIVADSDERLEGRLLVHDLGSALPDARPAAATDAPDWQTIARIDAFIEAHPDQKATINALLIRKALLFLQAGKPNMATAAFAAYDASIPGNVRDRGLYDAHRVLVWWWRVAPIADASALPPIGSFESRLTELSDTLESLPTSGIRYYLTNIRAHMTLKYSQQLDEPVEALRDGLNAYCAEFPEDAKRHIRVLFDESATAEMLAGIPEQNLRWYAQVGPLVHEYEKEYERFRRATETPLPGLDLDPACRWMQTL